MKVLGLHAKSGHGKDFAAKIAFQLAKEQGAKTLIWAFAHPLKARVYAEARGEFTFEDVWHRKPPALRHLLQQAGTEKGRNVYGEGFWLAQSEAFIRLFEEQSEVDLVIIPDVRFVNEVLFCHLGGFEPSRYDDHCWAEARQSLEFTPELEQQYLDDGKIEELLEIEQDIGALQSLLWQAAMQRGRCLRIRSDRPTLKGDAALHESETALDHLPDSAFSGVLYNNLDVTAEGLTEQLRPIITDYLVTP